MVGTDNKQHHFKAVERPCKSIRQIKRRREIVGPTPKSKPQLDLSFLSRIIHTGDTGQIVFAKGSGKTFEQRYSVERKLFAKTLGELQQYLDGDDAYYSINAFCQDRGGHSINPCLRRPIRQGWNLRFLNACHVDIDCGKKGLDIDIVLKRLHRLVVRGTIPLPSILVESGRGIWLLWLLQDQDTRGPVLADPKYYAYNYQEWGKIQHVLTHRLLPLGADASAKDATRFMRIPGSVNAKSGRLVRFWPIHEDGEIIRYSLPDLKSFLRIPQVSRKKCRKVTKPARSKRREGIWGPPELAKSRLRKLFGLESHRQGFRNGTRNNAVLLFCLFARQAGLDSFKVRDEAHKMGQRCKDQFPPREVDNAFQSAYKLEKVTDVTIANWLHISEEEASLVGWPAEGSDPKAKARTISRRAEVSVYIARLINRTRWSDAFEGMEKRKIYVAPLPTLYRAVIADGIKRSRSSFYEDMKALGLTADFLTKRRSVRTLRGILRRARRLR